MPREHLNKMIKKHPITSTIVFAVIFGIVTGAIENYYEVDINVIVLSLTAIFTVSGYFLTHYLEIVRKQREERLSHYRELASKIRVFVKGMSDKSEMGQSFDEVYYSSWMTISSHAYEELVKYLEAYKIYTDGKEEEKKRLLEELQKNLKNFMTVIREEFVSDKAVEFKDYDFRWNSKEK